MINITPTLLLLETVWRSSFDERGYKFNTTALVLKLLS